MIKLIAVLVSGIPAIISALLAFFARKIGTASGSIAAWIALTTAFVAANQTLFNQLGSLLNPPSWISNGLGMFIPGDFGLCLSTVVAAKISRAAYDLARDKIALINAAN